MFLQKENNNWSFISKNKVEMQFKKNNFDCVLLLNVNYKTLMYFQPLKRIIKDN